MINREIIKLELEPIIEGRFQPTGFPEIGAAIYKRPVRSSTGKVSWENAILVESAQSIANHLESVCWNPRDNRPIEELNGLPYVRVVNSENEFLTSSRIEPHRLASAYIWDSMISGKTANELFNELFELKIGRPPEFSKVVAGIFKLDPFSLIHGVFFSRSELSGQPKVTRAVTGAVEALNTGQVHSGGVKRDEVNPSNKESGLSSNKGYGMVPFQRTEYVAERIVASFVIDYSQIESYGLGDEASKLLINLAKFEIRQFIDSGIRLRTACDLVVKNLEEVKGQLPTSEVLVEDLKKNIQQCSEMFYSKYEIIATWDSKKAKAPTKGQKSDSKVESSEIEEPDLDDDE